MAHSALAPCPRAIRSRQALITAVAKYGEGATSTVLARYALNLAISRHVAQLALATHPYHLYHPSHIPNDSLI